MNLLGKRLTQLICLLFLLSIGACGGPGNVVDSMRIDTDGDGLVNRVDTDDDGDGISDVDDIAPLSSLVPPPLVWDAGDWGETKWQ